MGPEWTEKARRVIGPAFVKAGGFPAAVALLQAKSYRPAREGEEGTVSSIIFGVLAPLGLSSSQCYGKVMGALGLPLKRARVFAYPVTSAPPA